MDMQLDDLIRSASAVRKQAYAPYSGFAVGRLFHANRALFCAPDIENISYGLTICAERIAIASAVAAGERQFVAIAVVADTSEPTLPCGACRILLSQLLWS